MLSDNTFHISVVLAHRSSKTIIGDKGLIVHKCRPDLGTDSENHNWWEMIAIQQSEISIHSAP